MLIDRGFMFKRLAILVAALALLPCAAAAQMAPVQRGFVAQPQNVHGITVSGSATTRLPASSARITLMFSTSDRSLTLTKSRLQPVVDALVKSGVDASEIHFPPNMDAPGGSNQTTISAAVAHPTAELMQQGILTVGASVASLPNVVLNGAQVWASTADCASALDGVRKNALQQARAKAESIASDLHVHVGEPINVIANDQTSPDGSCNTQYVINGYMNGPNSPLTPADYVTVPVSSFVTITYAIR